MDKTVRIAIVEDSDADRELLRKNLRRYEREKALNFDLCEFVDGEDLLTGYTADYDLIFMDIKMTFMDGMHAAKSVRALDPNVEIIFVTNMPQYAIEGYKVRAVDFVLKPISYFSFSESLSRALHSVLSKPGTFITISQKGGKARLETDLICYVEAQDHELIFNTLNGNYVTKGTMSDAEEQLDTECFFRCSRCYLVNLKHIESYQGYDIRVNGDMIQISRRRRKSFLDALNAYINGERR